jgi:beta-glucanase (GH16 family)
MRRVAVLAWSLALASVLAAPAATAALSAPATAAAGSATSGSWHLVFSDGFGAGSLRTSAWTPNWVGTSGEVTKPPNSYELAAMDPAQVTFDAYGHLQLTPKSDPWTASDGWSFPDRSGAITGYLKQGYTPDIEAVARLRMPCTSTGQIKNWPSFWLVGDPFHWPQSGEIDIVEGIAGEAAWHAHYVAPDGSRQGPGGAVPGNWCGWHTFAVVWWGQAVKWYYDWNKVAEIDSYNATAPEFPVIMYSMAPRGYSLSDCPSGCSGPQALGVHMKADYVHIYQWY